MKSLPSVRAGAAAYLLFFAVGQGGCSSTKVLDPAVDACNPKTVLLSIECGSGIQPGADVTIALTRQADGKQKLFDATLKCDKPLKIEVAVQDYETGAAFDVAVSASPGGTLLRATKQLDDKCTFWTLSLTKGDVSPDAGNEPTPDADPLVSLDASPDLKEIQVEAGVKLGQGMECSKNEHCASDACVEGVCCESDCRGSCRSCLKLQTGKADGVCANVEEGKDPRNDCTVAPEACGTEGSCDGAGSCKLRSNQTMCAPATCTAEGAKAASMCDGKGICAAQGAQNCGQYACASGVCKSSCAGEGDCISGVKCINDLCGGKRANGQTCAGADECSSGVCVEGVCCGSACGGLCESCLKAKNGQTNGECRPVSDATDPDNECATEGTCGGAGVCDGARHCALKAAGTPCAAANCASGQSKPGLVCNGSGTCLDTGATPCGNFKCGPTACITQCASDGDCVSGAYCDSGVCYPKRTKGSSCTKDLECTTGLVCSDEGICCNSKCSAACNSCKQASTGKTNGECHALPVAVRDTRCADQGPASCKTTGFCGAGGQCANYADGTTCVGAACSGDGLKEIKPRTCDGSGSCRAVGETSCGNGRCDASTKQCSNVCMTAAQCAPSVECLNATCGGKLNQGQACVSNNQCSNGRCKDGFCCESDCAGACEACSKNKSGADDGLCRAIPAGQNPKAGGLCSAAPLCGQTGKCDGNKGCQLALAGTPCSAGSCSNNKFSGPAACSGTNASCPPVSATDCDAYKCTTSGCPGTCSTATDCSAPYYECISSKCQIKRIKGIFAQGSSVDNGVMLVAVGTTIYVYNLGSRTWSSVPAANSPYFLPLDCSYYAVPPSLGVGIQYYLSRGTKISYVVEYASPEWHADRDITTEFLFPNVPGVQAGQPIWTSANAPFQSTNDGLSACYILPIKNGGGQVTSETLVVWRGTTAYWIDNSGVTPWTKSDAHPDKAPTFWKGTEGPFDNDARSMDAAYYNRFNDRLTVFRGETSYHLVDTTNNLNNKVWIRRNVLKETVPYAPGHDIDFRAAGAPYHKP